MSNINVVSNSKNKNLAQQSPEGLEDSPFTYEGA